MATGFVDGDAEEEAPDAALATPATHRTRQTQEDVVDQIFGGVGVAKEADSEPADGMMMLVVKPGNRICLATAGTLQHRGVGGPTRRHLEGYREGRAWDCHATATICARRPLKCSK